VRWWEADSWSNELILRQSPTGNNVSTEIEDNFRDRNQATSGESITNRILYMRCS
jgi:hypothetical protein